MRGIGSSSSGPAQRVVDPEGRKKAGKKENRVEQDADATDSKRPGK